MELMNLPAQPWLRLRSAWRCAHRDIPAPGVADGRFKSKPGALKCSAGALMRSRPGHSAFHGITLRSNSWNSADVMRPRNPMVTMPQNMVVTSSNSHEFQIR